MSIAGAVHDSVISDCDFIQIGDSGVVVVGRLPADAPYDGTKPEAQFPLNVTIARSLFGKFGVFGKQTSALFVAVSKRVRLIDCVIYDGPRAGGYCIPSFS